MSEKDTQSDGPKSKWTFPRREVLGVLSAVGLGAAFPNTVSGNAGRNEQSGRPWYNWKEGVDANGNALTGLGALSMESGASITDFAGRNLSVDADGTLNATGTPESIHVVTDYPGDTLDQKLESVLAALPSGDGIPTQQPGHRIVIPAPTPDDPAGVDGLPAWRWESPVEIDQNTGKLVFEMGWTLIYATASIESFLVIGPDEKTENINLYGGMFYAKGNLERSFIDIQGVGHMHVSRMYLQSLAARNSVPAGIRLADAHGSSELTIEDTEVTGCTDAFYATQTTDVPYGAAFDLDMYNWRGGGGETSIRIDGGVGIDLHSIQTGGHPLQSVSDSIVKLENSTNAVRKANISFVRERHNAMDYHSGVRVVDVTDGAGDHHDGVYIQTVDCHNADHGTDIEHVRNFDQQNIRPAPVVGDTADGSTRWFDDGVQRHETTRSHEFHAGGTRSFVVDENDVRVSGAGNGAILTSPDGQSQYRIRVDNDGTVVTEAVDTETT